MRPVIAADFKCVVGENPLWHPDEGALYWVDIPEGRLMRYSPARQCAEEVHRSDRAIGGFTLQEDGSLLFFMARGAVARWRHGEVDPVIEELPEESDSRFNDVVADPAGRVFCGTMSSDSHPGRLYRLDPGGTPELLLEGLGTSNGMGFSPDLKSFYHTDTRACEIYVYDYDVRSGAISNKRVFIKTSGQLPGRPDGMAVDTEGCIWSAMWDGSSLVRFDRKGKVDLQVEFPAKKVSCPAFGGPQCKSLYVTTAGGNNRQREGPGAGALFRLDSGIAGMKEFRSKI